jgi:DNA-binding HxlR family transcriptional regulator
MIVCALESGPMLNAALMGRLGDVSQKMLTQTLKEWSETAGDP